MRGNFAALRRWLTKPSLVWVDIIAVSVVVVAGTMLIWRQMTAGAPPPAAPSTNTSAAATPVVRSVPAADTPIPPVPPAQPKPVAVHKPQPAPEVVVTPQYVKDPLSLSMIVNKRFQLRATFVPGDLRSVNVAKAFDEALRGEAATALEQMFADAAASGISLKMNSAYRSYEIQKIIYDQYVARSGVAAADMYSARPGFSEHQSGLAADVIQHGATTAGAANAWMAANSHKYGYIVRYPQGKAAVTGYNYEPWHIRYVGAHLAAQLVAAGKTMEEHFNVPGGDYVN